MDSFDKKIKNIFEHIDDVPSDFDWDHMEEGIYDKMNKLQASPPNPSGIWKTWKVVLWGSVSIAVLFIIYFSWTNFTKKQNQTEIITEQLQQKNDTKEPYDKKSTSSDIADSGKINNDENTSQVVHPAPPDSGEEKVKKAHLPQPVVADDDIADSDIEKNIEKNNLKDSKVAVSDNNQSTDKKITGATENKRNIVIKRSDRPQSSRESVSRDYKETPADKNSVVIANASSNELHAVIEKLPSLPLKTLELSSGSHDVTGYIVQANAPVIRTGGSASKLNLDVAVEMNSGINYWNGTYKNAPTMNQYANSKIGFYNSLDVVLATRKWDFTIGYKYRYINELLDYEKVTMVPVAFDSVLLHTFTENYTHVTEKVYGDTTVMRERTIKIVNYNSIVSHIGVVGIARKFQVNNQITCGISLGAQYAFNATAKGVQLDEQEHYSIYKNNAGKQLELNTGVFLAYSIKPKWMLVSHLSYTKVMENLTIGNREITGQNVVNLGIGLRYLL